MLSRILPAAACAFALAVFISSAAVAAASAPAPGVQQSGSVTPTHCAQFVGNLAVGDAGVACAVPTPGTCTPTAATQAAILACVTVLESSPGQGTVLLPAGTINLASSLPLISGISYQGASISLSFTGITPEAAVAASGGTILNCTGSGYAALSGNTASKASPDTNFNDNALANITLSHFASTGCAGLVSAGGHNNMGMIYGHLDDLWSFNDQSGYFAFNLVNSMLMSGNKLEVNEHLASGCPSGFLIGQDVSTTVLQTGNSNFADWLYSGPTTCFTDVGIAFTGVNGSLNNMISGRRLQANNFRTGGLLSQAATMTASSPTIVVTTGSAFKQQIGCMPVTVSATANGFTAGVTYFVTLVSGNNINLAARCNGTAISATGSAAVNITSYGSPRLLIWADSTSGVNGLHLDALDLEGQAQGQFVAENTNNSFFDFSTVAPTTGQTIPAFVWRSDTYNQYVDADGFSYDADAVGDAFVSGATYGPIAGSYWLLGSARLLTSGGGYCLNLDISSGASCTLRLNNPGGSFLTPGTSIGEHVQAQGAGYTVNAAACGFNISIFAAAETFTLPSVGNPTSPNASYQGCHQTWLAEQGPTTISNPASQYFNGTAVASYTAPIGQFVDLRMTYGNPNNMIGAYVMQGVGEPKYEPTAAASPTVATAASTVTIADNVGFKGLLPAAALSSLVIALPHCDTNYPTHVVEFRNESAFTISSITYTAVSGSLGTDLPTSLTSGQDFTARCEAAAATPGWY